MSVPPGTPLAWVEARDSDSPEQLRVHVRSSLAAVPDTGLVGTLVAASSACLSRALDLGIDRAAAAELLAADALLTYACEAAAERAVPDGYDALLSQVVAEVLPLLTDSP